MQQVRETKAGRAIGAFVIFNRIGQHVATVQAHYGNSRVNVDIWHTDGAPLQQSSASGYGYDKFTAAISGLTIDGHSMTDHCGEQRKPPRGKKCWQRGARIPKGYSFANWSAELNGWRNCYREAGLSYLTAIGCTVIRAI